MPSMREIKMSESTMISFLIIAFVKVCVSLFFIWKWGKDEDNQADKVNEIIN